MKIKRLISSIVVISTTIFPISLQTKNKINTENKVNEYFSTLEKQTPSQFNAMNIKYYFQTLGSPFYVLQEDHSSDSSESKTSIFNQSMIKFVKEMYNNKYYSDFLSQDGTHIIDFLNLSCQANLDIESLYTGIRLFYNKIKACELIDDTVIIQVLEPLPKLLGKYFEIEEYKIPTFDSLSKNIESVILYKFTEHIQDFQQEPNSFITKLSEEIGSIAKKEIETLEKNKEKKEILERLRQIIIRFFELGLSKTMWEPKSYEGIWESVISIANGLQLLGVHGILDHMDDLDDLLWSLVHRFCFFLDLAGSSLPLTFYEEIESDLESKIIFFLEAQELDEGIKTKKDTLIKALLKAKAKAYAFEKNGLFTDQLI